LQKVYVQQPDSKKPSSVHNIYRTKPAPPPCGWLRVTGEPCGGNQVKEPPGDPEWPQAVCALARDQGQKSGRGLRRGVENMHDDQATAARQPLQKPDVQQQCNVGEQPEQAVADPNEHQNGKKPRASAPRIRTRFQSGISSMAPPLT